MLNKNLAIYAMQTCNLKKALFIMQSFFIITTQADPLKSNFEEQNIYLEALIGQPSYNNSIANHYRNNSLVKSSNSIKETLNWGIGINIEKRISLININFRATHKIGHAQISIADLSKDDSKTEYPKEDLAAYSEQLLALNVGPGIKLDDRSYLISYVGINHNKISYTHDMLERKKTKVAKELDLITNFTSIPVGIAINTSISDKYTFKAKASYYNILELTTETFRPAPTDSTTELPDNKRLDFSHRGKENNDYSYAFGVEFNFRVNYDDNKMPIKSIAFGGESKHLYMRHSDYKEYEDKQYSWGPAYQHMYTIYLSFGI